MPKMRLHVDLKKRLRLRFRAAHWISLVVQVADNPWMREAFVAPILNDFPHEEAFKSMFLRDWPSSPLPSEEKPPELHKEWSVGRLYPKQQEMLNDPRPMRLFGGSRR